MARRRVNRKRLTVKRLAKRGPALQDKTKKIKTGSTDRSRSLVHRSPFTVHQYWRRFVNFVFTFELTPENIRKSLTRKRTKAEGVKQRIR